MVSLSFCRRGSPADDVPTVAKSSNSEGSEGAAVSRESFSPGRWDFQEGAPSRPTPFRTVRSAAESDAESFPPHSRLPGLWANFRSSGLGGRPSETLGGPDGTAPASAFQRWLYPFNRVRHRPDERWAGVVAGMNDVGSRMTDLTMTLDDGRLTLGARMGAPVAGRFFCKWAPPRPWAIFWNSVDLQTFAGRCPWAVDAGRRNGLGAHFNDGRPSRPWAVLGVPITSAQRVSKP